MINNNKNIWSYGYELDKTDKYLIRTDNDYFINLLGAGIIHLLTHGFLESKIHTAKQIITIIKIKYKTKA